MGSTTPNISIYCPAAGEDGYEEAFTAGMVNIDQHDHSGGPNKGLPIATEGLAAGSVTFDKLATNVVSPTSGVGTSGLFPNQIILLHPLSDIFALAGSSGLITMDGTTAHVRTLVDTASVKWTNGNGVAGNITANVDIGGLSPIVVANGGTGKTSLTPYAILAGGTTNTGNVQQVSGLGTAAQVLTSSGSGLPTWQDIPAQSQNLLTAQVTLTDAQFRSLNKVGGIGIQVVANAGSGTILIPYNAWGKLVYGGSAAFGTGASVKFYYGAGLSNEASMAFVNGCFKDANTAYYSCITETPSSTTGLTVSSIENRSIYVSVDGASFTGGAGNSVVISVQYSVLTL